jgi:hypothetical protein
MFDKTIFFKTLFVKTTFVETMLVNTMPVKTMFVKTMLVKTMFTLPIAEIICVKNVRAIVVCGFLLKSFKNNILKI